MPRPTFFCCTWLFLVLPSAFPASLAAAEAAEEAATFELKEVSVFDPAGLTQDEQARLVGGQGELVANTPHEEVKAYPKLHSKQPLYGVVPFNAGFFDRSEPVKRYFVLDETEGQADEETIGPLLQSIVKTLSGQPYRPRPQGKYNRLYFDLNGDNDLTNDPPVGLMKDPPEALATQDGATFDSLEVPFDLGPGLGQRPVQIIPRLRLFGADHGYVTFVVPLGRKGDIRVGRREHTALLSQSNTVTGRFDRRTVALLLTPKAEKAEPQSIWTGWLFNMREVDGQWYDLSASPLGDKLTVTPYTGPRGTLQISPGDRNVEKCSLGGGVYSKDRLVLLGTLKSQFELDRAPRFELPVGDYEPAFFVVEIGHTVVNMHPNVYREGDSNAQFDRPARYRLAVREDKPCVLELREKPKVLFTTPPKDQVLKPGETVQIQAVLVEPTLDLMVGGIDDTSKQQGSNTFRDGEGNTVTVANYKSVVPKVVITDSSGKQVAQGDMPFG